MLIFQPWLQRLKGHIERTAENMQCGVIDKLYMQRICWPWRVFNKNFLKATLHSTHRQRLTRYTWLRYENGVEISGFPNRLLVWIIQNWRPPHKGNLSRAGPFVIFGLKISFKVIPPSDSDSDSKSAHFGHFWKSYFKNMRLRHWLYPNPWHLSVRVTHVKHTLVQEHTHTWSF